MKKVLVFDVETNGLPKKYKAPMTDLDNWPRVAQMAWGVHDLETGETVFKDSMVYPDGWEIPKEDFFIKNNMSTERCMEEGVELSHVLEEFIDDINQCDLLVAHNMTYDYNVVGSEMIRLGLKAKKKLPQYCTKDETTNLLKLPGQYGGYKWPKLEELHQFLFGKDFEGAHDALFDVKATLSCFQELNNRGLVNA